MRADHDEGMSAWRRRTVPGLAAVAAFLLVAASVAGIDEMANAKIPGVASETVQATALNTEPGLEHILLAGLNQGTLPGGFPNDDVRDDKYDDDYLETLHVQPSPPA
ncbi:hypothetical protein ACVLB3_002525 [Pseudarthrobacter sp. PvP022]